MVFSFFHILLFLFFGTTHFFMLITILKNEGYFPFLSVRILFHELYYNIFVEKRLIYIF